MIERTSDYRRVSRLTKWWPVITNKIIYLIETDGERDYGVWSFHEHMDKDVMIHADMTKSCRGRKAVESAKNAFKWIFENTLFQTIHAKISTTTNMERGACLVAKWSGMKFVCFDNNKRHYEVNKNG